MPQYIKKIINEFIKEVKKDREKKEKVVSLVEQIIDINTKRHIKSYRIYKDTLIIYVDSSIWSYQINLWKNKLLKKLKEEVEVKDLKVKLSKR